MALDKTPLQINFAQGLDQKTDPKQVMAGKFLSLYNSVFDKMGLLTKRNGFLPKTSLPNNLSTFLATHNGNLVAIGNHLQTLSQDTDAWVDRGSLQPATLSITPQVRSADGQVTLDIAVADNGLACSVFSNPAGMSSYQVCDNVTGQVIVSTVLLPSTATKPRVFLLSRFFIITFLVTVGGATNLKYIALPIVNPSVPSAATVISTVVVSLSSPYDGVIYNNALYIALGATDGGGAVRITYIDQTLVQHGTVVLASFAPTRISMTQSTFAGGGVIWIGMGNVSTNQYYVAYNPSLAQILAPTLFDSGLTLSNLTMAAKADALFLFYDIPNTYTSSVPSRFIKEAIGNISGGLASHVITARSVGLASKAFLVNNDIYLLSAYGGTLQPTYFLINESGQVVAKLAYANGIGYPTSYVLPQGNVVGNAVQIGYLIHDLAVSVSKDQNATNTSNIYTQSGANLVTFTIGKTVQKTTEIGKSLELTGGITWQYDGKKPVELGFSLWPEDLFFTTATTGGLMTSQLYYYQAVYAWTDAQGLIHRSAPSIPLRVDLTGAGTNTNEVTINVPTDRLTYKVTPNPIIIEIYRWSLAQQNYYLVTSINAPLLNDTTVDSVSFLDTRADTSILGNPLIYTTGNVVENISPPSFTSMSLFQSRLFGIDAEDRNSLWFSKQVIEGTPVEMTDLFTIFVAPTIGAQGATGDLQCLAPMDDKLILFKSQAIYYINGTGPDNTGANNQFSEPTFITSTVGCSNQSSIIFIPSGLMFESDKGIWILDRSLSTQYIGAPVEDFTANASVVSALTIPGTNQVRFTLSSGITLMYDYYFQQWSAFKGISAISSTLYQNLHTYLNSFGMVLQESQGKYLDGSVPVCMSFETSWIKLGGLQGYQRAYFFYLLGSYFSPHKLSVDISYDYDQYPSQTTQIIPDNNTARWGEEAVWGGGDVWGGGSNLEQWRVFLQNQRCEAFKISITEIFDPSVGQIAGPGLTLSGLNMLVGIKRNQPTLRAARSVG